MPLHPSGEPGNILPVVTWSLDGVVRACLMPKMKIWNLQLPGWEKFSMSSWWSPHWQRIKGVWACDAAWHKWLAGVRGYNHLCQGFEDNLHVRPAGTAAVMDAACLAVHDSVSNNDLVFFFLIVLFWDSCWISKIRANPENDWNCFTQLKSLMKDVLKWKQKELDSYSWNDRFRCSLARMYSRSLAYWDH